MATYCFFKDGIDYSYLFKCKVGTGCKEAGEKNYVGNISGNLQHL
jgi:hypothetical protein